MSSKSSSRPKGKGCKGGKKGGKKYRQPQA